jgi:hypothetical protein
VILLSSLYPVGQLLTHIIPSPCDELPTGEALLKVISDEILDSATHKRTRPNKLVFTNPDVLASIYHALIDVKIEPSYINTFADGIFSYVQQVSKLMVTKDIARDSGFVSGLPSILDVMNNNVHTSLNSGASPVADDLVNWVRNYYGSATSLLEIKPWEFTTSRDAFRLTLPTTLELYPGCSVTAPEVVYVTVVNDQVDDGDGTTDTIQGIALFTRRIDMITRLLGAEYVDQTFSSFERVCSGSGVKENLEEGEGENKKEVVKLKSLKPPMFDIRTSREALFSSTDAQRSAWKALRKHLVTADKLVAGKGHEYTMLYKQITTMPFADLDEIAEFGFEVAKARGEGHFGVGGREDSVYPFITKVFEGKLDRPSKAEIGLVALATAVVQRLSSDDAFREELKKSTFTAGGDVTWTKGSVTVGEGKCETKVGVQYEPVWLRSELESAVSKVRQAKGELGADGVAQKQEREQKEKEESGKKQGPEGVLEPEQVEDDAQGGGCIIS